ncbi:MAG: HepT-like ribonuclease domain-containing protein [Blastocatellia bacterium]
MSFEEFCADKKTVDAAIRNLEIIGESVKNIPSDFFRTQEEIEWKKIARFRDLLAHRYFRIDLEVVWDVLQNNVAALENGVREIMATFPETEK